jgi:hypothetical protein
MRAIEGAAMIFGEQRAEGLKRLAEAEASRATAEVQELITVARALTAIIEAPPDKTLQGSADGDPAGGAMSRPEQAVNSKAQAPREGHASQGKQHPLLAKTRAILADVDKLLEEASS